MGWTNVLPGSTRYPDILLEWAPTTAPTAATPLWEDITDLLRGWSWSYGRNDELARFEAGNGSVLLDNRDRLFDPSFDGGDATNVIPNGGSSTSLDAGSNWVPFGFIGTLTRDNAQSKFSQWAMKFVGAGGASGTEGPVTGTMSPAAASTAYTQSAYIYSAAGGAQVVLQASFYTAATMLVNTIATGTVTLVAGWNRLTVSGTSGALVTKAETRIKSMSAASQTFWVDGVQLETGTAATRYIETDGAASSRLATNIKPRRMFRLQARYAGSIYGIFVGYAVGFPQSYPGGGFDNVVQVPLVDAFAVMQGIDLTVGYSAPEQKAATRIKELLVEIGFSTLKSVIDGDSLVGTFAHTPTPRVAALEEVATPGTSSLDHLKAVAESAGGQFFVSPSGGFVTFHCYDRRLNQASIHTFSDDPSATLRYESGIDPAYDLTYLWNTVRVTGAGGEDSVETTDDLTSQGEYHIISKPISTLLVSGSDIKQLADRTILRYSEPEQRAAALPLQGANNPSAMWPAILGLRVSDRITIERFATSTDPMTLIQNVEGVSHTCPRGGPWKTTIRTSPADTNTYLELDDGVTNELDNGYMLT